MRPCSASWVLVCLLAAGCGGFRKHADEFPDADADAAVSPDGPAASPESRQDLVEDVADLPDVRAPDAPADAPSAPDAPPEGPGADAVALADAAPDAQLIQAGDDCLTPESCETGSCDPTLPFREDEGACTSGWRDAVPACGAKGVWRDLFADPSCRFEEIDRVQRCVCGVGKVLYDETGRTSNMKWIRGPGPSFRTSCSRSVFTR